jgi:shikimate kinase
MNKHILLIGMPGCGKSTISKLLATELSLPCIDTDSLLEQQYGTDLPSVLDQLGEIKFLEAEAALIDETLEQSPCIISPGGSIVYHQRLYPKIQSTATVIYLEVSLSELKNRVGSTPRGIIQHGKTYDELFAERKSLYEDLADYTVDANQNQAQIVENIVLLICRRFA